MNSHPHAASKGCAALSAITLAIVLMASVLLDSTGGGWLAEGARAARSLPHSAGSAAKNKKAPDVDRDAYAKLPMSFVANQGQADPGVSFVAHGPGYGLFLTRQGAVFSLHRTAAGTSQSQRTAQSEPPLRDSCAVSMRLKNAGPGSHIVGVEELPGKVNYLHGRNVAEWQTNVPTFSRVRQDNVYPGVDLLYYGNQRQLEYDFEIAPGADPGIIRLDFSGAKLRLDARGDLKVITPIGTVSFLKPQSYQQVGGKRQSVASRYVLTAGNELAFRVGRYDKGLPLVIDPVLAYSTYLGGTDDEFGFAIAVDSAGNAYVTGQTFSTDFPNLGSTQHGDLDAYVTKINPSGSAVVYSTFLGGSGSDTAYGIAVDSTGNAFVTGKTNSNDFPLLNPLDSTLGGSLEVFVSRLSSSGSALVYSTYLGGSAYDAGYSIALDQNDNAYVTGETGSRDFPVANPIQSTKSGNALFKSSDGAAHWNTSDAGLIGVTVNGIAFDPTNSAILYAGTDTGVFKSTNGGAGWSVIGLPQSSGAVSKVAVDPTNRMIIYAATNGGIYKSLDGGDHFVSSSTGITPMFTSSVVISPSNTSNLYACGAGSRVFRSTDAAGSWTSSNLTSASLAITLAVDPANASVVYAGSNRGVYKSTDAGVTWLAPNTSLRNTIRSLAVDRLNPAVVYAGGTGGIFKSTDGGINWSNISPSGNIATVNALAIDPIDSATVYYGTSTSIYKSSNGGTSWSLTSSGYAATIVNALLIDPANPASLYAGTNGGPDVFISMINPAGTAQIYATFFGGTRIDVANGIAVDSSGNAYIAGYTTSLNLPTTNPLQSNSASGDEAFVAKVNSTGSAFIYSTYLGGDGPDRAWGIAVDAQENAYVVGETSSTNFPTVNPLPSAGAPFNSQDAFITKLNSAGSSLVYSTYLGGRFNDQGFAVAVNAQGSAFVTGVTSSSDFPQVNQLANGAGTTDDAFVAKLHPTGSSLLYSTRLGGGNFDQGLGIALDSAGSAYLTGDTTSSDFPLAAPYQSTSHGGEEVFVARISPSSNQIHFTNSSYNASEGAGSVQISVTRAGDLSGTATVEFSTFDGTANQKRDYSLAAGTLNFAVGEASKTFRVLIIDNAYLDGNRTVNLSLANSIGAETAEPAVASLVIEDNDMSVPTANPIDDAVFFVRQHYYDFLSRVPDQPGLDYWSGQIAQCGTDQACLRTKRVDVSNAFFYEQEYQQTGAYVYRLYRAAFGNNQPFPNPFPNAQYPGEEKKIPSYLVFALDRARVKGGSNLAQTQLDLATAFVQRPAFVAKYSASLSGAEFVDAVLLTLSGEVGADLMSQRQALIDLFNQGGRAAVIYRIADDNQQTNPINNRTFIDSEYNRAFVATQYFGYLRRNPDIPGFLFWLGQVNGAPLRDVPRQHAMVCSFITSTEYQQRFSSVVTHSNVECQ